jgi:S-adenosyl methyltransferase
MSVDAERGRQGPDVANIARIYDFWLGGTNNFRADRRAARDALRAKPQLRDNALAGRRLLARMVGHLAGEAGVRQFLDIGTGLPTMNSTHEVAQAAAPESRIVYVDNDQDVIVTARALLTSGPAGAADYIQADLRDTSRILHEAARTLDLDRPVAIMLLLILHFIPDADDPYRLVQTLVDAVPTGSYLAIAHPASDIHGDEAARGGAIYQRRTGVQLTYRNQGQVARFFDGLQLVSPGVVPAPKWRPDDQEDPDLQVSVHAALGRKP